MHSVLIFTLTLLSIFAVPIEAYFYQVPISISEKSSTPYMTVEIENEKYSILIDLGSQFPFALRKEILQNLEKTFYETIQSKDIFGIEYETPVYIIPEITAGDILVKNMVTKEEEYKLVYSSNGDLTDTETDGSVGLPLLSLKNLLLDFSKPMIFATDSHDLLDLLGYDLDQFQKVSFQESDEFILFSIELDIGSKQFILDTGCTWSFLRSDLLTQQTLISFVPEIPIYETSKFKIGGHDFGEIELCSLKMAHSELFDGILGMDFLEEHIVYIDFSANVLYIKR